MTDNPLREVIARALCARDGGLQSCEGDSRCIDGDMCPYPALADAAIAAIEASGTYVAEREYEALARAARAYLEHPDLASAADTLRGMVQRAERVLAARPRDAARTDQGRRR